MAWGKDGAYAYLAKLTALLSLFLAAALLTASSCGPPPPSKPITKIPSAVLTEGGLQFYVYGFKLPGTNQDLRLKQTGATTWVPLSIVQYVIFTGPELDRYRPARIGLTAGDKLEGDLFVDQIVEGTTDVGYWNIQLRDVKQLNLGED